VVTNYNCVYLPLVAFEPKSFFDTAFLHFPCCRNTDWMTLMLLIHRTHVCKSQRTHLNIALSIRNINGVVNSSCTQEDREATYSTEQTSYTTASVGNSITCTLQIRTWAVSGFCCHTQPAIITHRNPDLNHKPNYNPVHVQFNRAVDNWPTGVCKWAFCISGKLFTLLLSSVDRLAPCEFHQSMYLLLQHCRWHPIQYYHTEVLIPPDTYMICVPCFII